MEPKPDQQLPEQPAPAEGPAPRKRFRIEKLEERIAPTKGGGNNASGTGNSTNNGNHGGGGESSASGSLSISFTGSY
jgi:hypothetical protein